MSEKTLNNVRIVNKHDTEVNWLKATGFIPKQGELIVYDIDDTHSYERLKIGDGVQNVNALPFIEDNIKSSVPHFLGVNIINNVEEDTIENWVSYGSGYAFIGNEGVLNNQPSRYGFVISYVHDNDIFQIWKQQPGGTILIRSGNAAGWSEHWRLIDAASATVANNADMLDGYHADSFVQNSKFTELVGDTSVSDQINNALETALFFKYLSVQMPANINWTDIAYGDGKYVAVATESNIAAYSTDGMNWTQTTMPTTAQWNRVVYGSGVFIATAYFTNVCAYSYDGIDWVQGSVVTNLKYTSLVYDGSYGMFYAVPEEGYMYKYTMDGSDWGDDQLPASAMWSDMTFDGSQCIIVAMYSNKILCGNLGYWEEKTHSCPASGLIAVASNGNGLTVALGSDGTGHVCWTSDRSTWNNAFISERNWRDIAYGNGKFVTIASNTDAAAYSEDGSSWTEVKLPSVEPWANVAYGNGMFVACCYDSDAVAISYDGIKWYGSEKAFYDNDGNDITDKIVSIIGNGVSAPKLATVTLTSSNWLGSSNPYHQDIVINGATKNSKIDLQPTAFQIVELQNADIMLMVENRDTFSRVYAIGGKPTNNYTMQALITEVVPV